MHQETLQLIQILEKTVSPGKQTFKVFPRDSVQFLFEQTS